MARPHLRGRPALQADVGQPRRTAGAAFLGERCGSVGHLAANLGYDSTQAGSLARLGYALEGCPGLEEALRRNEVLLATAYEIGRLYQRPELLLPEDDWVSTARSRTLPDLRRIVQKRLEALRQGAKTTKTVVLELCEGAQEDLDACRLLASQKARQALSNSQTAWAALRFYRETWDPRETKEGKRRMGPTPS